MSYKSKFDSIAFRYPGFMSEYHEIFTLPNDMYEVTLRPNSTACNRLIADVPSATSNLYLLTIKWNKASRKFMRIKVYDEITKRQLLRKKILKSSRNVLTRRYLALDNIPALFLLEIYTYENISKVNHEETMAEPKKSVLSTPFIKKEFEELSKDLKVLLDTGAFSDVTMTDGENKIQLHRLILSARSSVFNKMFEHPTKEKQEGLIRIPDISFEVLKVLVEYMYSGIVSIDDMEMARNLYIAADKYDIQSLKKITLEKLKYVTLDNILDNLLLANLYGENDLKNIAFTYIADNYSKVQNLQSWNEFTEENKDLALETLSYVLNNKIEK